MAKRAGLFTIGYEGLSIEQFLTKILENEIDTVVDVRLNPLSRKAGFSKTRLAAALANEGVGYAHERQLGNPPENRAAFRLGPLEQGRQRLRAILDEVGDEALTRLAQRSRRERVAILCVESTDVRCHRQVIVEMLREIDPGLPCAAIW